MNMKKVLKQCAKEQKRREHEVREILAHMQTHTFEN